MKLPLKETLIAGSCIAILCTLGTWQVQRLNWKNDITTKLQAQYEQGGRVLDAAELDQADITGRGFIYGSVTGRALKDKAVLLGPRMREGRSGYHLLLPIDVDGTAMIVNTGWVSDMWNDTIDERLGTLPVQITARGIIRHPDWSRFTSANSPNNNLWFRADAKEIADARAIEKIHNVILYADQIDPPLQDVIVHEERWMPRNKHAQYAAFWYALAMVMAIIYGVYLRKKNDA